MGFWRNPLSEAITETTVTFTPFQENHWLRVVRRDGTNAFVRFKEELTDTKKFREFWREENLAGIHVSEIDLIDDHEAVLSYLVDTIEAVINAINQEISHIDEIKRGDIRLRLSSTVRVKQEGQNLDKILYQKIDPIVDKIKARGNVLMTQADKLSAEIRK